MSVSQYKPVWDALKDQKHVRLQIEKEDDATSGQVKAQFTKIRKALSNCKLVDTEFMQAHPNSRLEVASSDLEAGILELKIIFLTPPFSMLALKD